MKRNRKEFAVRKLAHAIACLSVISAPALADATLPTGAVVKYGAASISTSGAAMQVNQRTQRAIINWNSFSIGDEASVSFVQPNAAAVALNRVTGNDLSKIDGQLKANGQVFISNPNGILFGAGSQVDVGGLVATTLNLDNISFAFGLNDFMGSSKAAVRNEGSLNGHNVALVGAQVINDGAIHADGVALASGSKVTLAFDGNGLVSAKVDQKLLDGYIENGGIIDVGAGRLLMTTGVASALQNSIINNTGIAQANSLTGQGGEIILSGDYVVNTGSLNADGSSGGSITTTADRILQAGSLDAQGSEASGGTINAASNHYRETKAGTENASGKTTGGKIALATQLDLFDSGSHIATGEQGGKIDISADAIQLRGATVDASGSAAGGTIRIGGGYQGKDADIKNATTTTIVNTAIDASATQDGNGGRVTVWSNSKTDFYGNIQVNAGTTGNGGFIEVSSHNTLNFGGVASASAANGKAGTLLLDPKDIVVGGAAPATINYIDLADPYPSASNEHGSGGVYSLPDGNVVVASPTDNYVAVGAGAVYLYGPDGSLVSMLSGSNSGDNVGSGGVTVLGNGNYVVASPNWHGTVGAVTWNNGVIGISGIVSAVNSLVGSHPDDLVGTRYTWFGTTGGGFSAVTALPNGNYVVSSPFWGNGFLAEAGAVTWGDGITGTTGVISATNSLVGSMTNDQVGMNGITVLANGNYVVSSPYWNNGATTQVGAVTWANGAAPTAGIVSATNSLVGSTAGDRVGLGDSSGVTALANGNYVVSSIYWNNGATSQVGAVTWANGTAATAGIVSAMNSLVGSAVNDQVGYGGVTALSNGNYVVNSFHWNEGANSQVGAVTWGDGSTGSIGGITSLNSLVGSSAYDQIGRDGITALPNGNYVVASSQYSISPSLQYVGAVTWGDGLMGVAGVVSSANSLIGSHQGDHVGANSYIGTSSFTAVQVLESGMLAIKSGQWNGLAGAITWMDASTGLAGYVSVANSLVGAQAHDALGSGMIYELPNGNIVLTSPGWQLERGAVTWLSGAAPLTSRVGTLQIDAQTSLVGASTGYLDIAGHQNPGDSVGVGGIVALAGGSYVINSPYWDHESGAATLADGSAAIAGVVSASNSRVGDRQLSVQSQTIFGGLVQTTVRGSGYQQSVIALDANDFLISNPWWGGNGSVTQASDGAPLVGVMNTSDFQFYDTTMPTSNGTPGIHATQLADGRIIVSANSWNYNGISDSGRVVLLDTGAHGESYLDRPSSLIGISPSLLLSIVSQGTGVILQANNDITLNNPLVVNNPSGNGGSLTLQAGRSINLNANIVTDDGDLTLIANDRLANGVVDAYRDPGVANIAMAPGVSIDAGNGHVDIELRDGAGKTHADSGSAMLGNITANSIRVIASGTAGINAGASLVATGTGDAIIMAGDVFDNESGASALTAANGRWLVYSQDPVADTFGGLLSGNPDLWARHWGDAVPEGGNRYVFANPIISNALPAGGTVMAGSASISNPWSTALQVDQSSQNLVINWSSFDIGPAASVTFNQPNASAIALNRVTGTDPSRIYGQLSANGQVYILNPNGVLFGAGSQINVGGLVASTFDISDANFLAGNNTLSGSSTAPVTNAGIINATTVSLVTGGAVNLDAGSVINASGTGDAIVLSGATFNNQAGAAALSASNGRWLVYSTNPANDSFGGLLSGNQALWGRSYPAVVAESGNRYVFSEQPTLTFTSASAYKAGLGSMGIQSLYTTRGYVDASLYGNVFTQDTQANTTTGAPLLSSAGANTWMGAGAYPVAISQGTLVPTTGYALAYNSAGRLTVGLSFMQRFQLLFHNLFARFRHA